MVTLGISVRIRVTGREPERFFNLCGHHNITLWDVTEHKGCFEMSLLPEDFFRLLPIRRKSGVRIRIQKKQALPFFYRRSLKRKAFFIGIFLCLAGLYTLSQFIWNIHVEGNYANSTQTILNSLDAAGIHHGSWKKRVDCSQTASYLREQFPNLTWVSAKIEGTMDLTALEFRILFGMAAHPGRVFTRENLLELAVGREFSRYDRSVDMHISTLRRKLGDDPHNPAYLKTIRGMGYTLLPEEA